MSPVQTEIAALEERLRLSSAQSEVLWGSAGRRRGDRRWGRPVIIGQLENCRSSPTAGRSSPARSRS